MDVNFFYRSCLLPFSLCKTQIMIGFSWSWAEPIDSYLHCYFSFDTLWLSCHCFTVFSLLFEMNLFYISVIKHKKILHIEFLCRCLHWIVAFIQPATFHFSRDCHDETESEWKGVGNACEKSKHRHRPLWIEIGTYIVIAKNMKEQFWKHVHSSNWRWHQRISTL